MFVSCLLSLCHLWCNLCLQYAGALRSERMLYLRGHTFLLLKKELYVPVFPTRILGYEELSTGIPSYF